MKSAQEMLKALVAAIKAHDDGSLYIGIDDQALVAEAREMVKDAGNG